MQDINPPVQAALRMTSPEVTNAVVRDCVEAGIRQVWMYRGMGNGAVSASGVAFCQEHAIEVIPGECPFMFLPGTAGVHRGHGFLHKIFGRYRYAQAAQRRAA